MGFYDDYIETGATLKAVAEAFDADLRAGLKTELMRLAEERVDAIVDETVKGLQARIDGARELSTMRQYIQITIKRMATTDAPKS